MAKDMRAEKARMKSRDGVNGTFGSLSIPVGDCCFKEVEGEGGGCVDGITVPESDILVCCVCEENLVVKI